MKSFSAALIAAYAAHVSAHGIVTKVVVGGTSTYPGYNPNFQYLPTPTAVIGWTAPQTQDRGPVDGNALSSPDIICGKGASPAALTAEVAAGSTMSFQWTEWPVSHKGPMLDYLAPCDGDCSTVDKTTLKFFKIDGVGMTAPTGTPPQFADDDMIANDMTWTVTIPASIAPGNYVLRHETIALHAAGNVGGSQPYPQCFNIKVTGSGTDKPEGVLGTQLYSVNEPGIQFNLYRKFTSTDEYPVPGPPLYSGAAAGGNTPTTPTTPTTPSTVPSVKPVAPSASAAAPAPSGSTGGKQCRLKRRHARAVAKKA